jgi:cold shock CspA family protein
MVKPVQVTFKNMPASGALESEARTRANWLETFYPSIIGCRVVVEIPHRHRARGRHVHVRIELSLPGEDLIVNHEPTLHRELKDTEEDSHRKGDDVEAVRKYAIVAVHEAFDTARRRLQEIARRQRDETKTHQEPDHGRVVALPDGSDHGFIETTDGRRVYFHLASVLAEGRAQLAVGADVAFVEEQGDQGPQASTVRVLGKHHYVTP